MTLPLGPVGPFVVGGVGPGWVSEPSEAGLAYLGGGGLMVHIGTRFGLTAIDAVHERDFGMMVALRGTDIVRVPLAAATEVLKTVPEDRYAEAAVLFG